MNKVGSFANYFVTNYRPFIMRPLYSLVLKRISPVLTHLSVASFCGTKSNSAYPDQIPQNAVSDQDIHCLLTEISIIFFFKNE